MPGLRHPPQRRQHLQTRRRSTSERPGMRDLGWEANRKPKKKAGCGSSLLIFFWLLLVQTNFDGYEVLT